MQVFFPAVEPYINTIAASVLSEAGMQQLVYVPQKVSDEPQRSAFLIAWCIGRAEHRQIPSNHLNNFGHEHIATTISVYGIYQPSRLAEIIKEMDFSGKQQLTVNKDEKPRGVTELPWTIRLPQ